MNNLDDEALVLSDGPDTIGSIFDFGIDGKLCICKLCCQVLDSPSRNELNHHIFTMHKDEQKNSEKIAVPIGRIGEFKDNPTALESAICHFLTKYGLPSNTVKDSSFVKMINSISEDTILPNPKSIEIFVKNGSEKHKKETHELMIEEPLTITIDFMKIGEDFSVAFSVHYLNRYLERKNIVFLQKLASYKLNPWEVLQNIRESIYSVVEKKRPKFANFLFPNSPLEKAFQDTQQIDNTFVCFFSYISNFAAALIRLKIFSTGIEKLRNFAISLRNDREIFTKFESYLYARGITCDLPDVDFSKWTAILDFLSEVLYLHQYFVKFFKNCSKSLYIDDEMHSELMCLHMVLSQLRTIGMRVSRPNSFISQVVPEVFELKRHIANTAPPELLQHFQTAFHTHLGPLIRHHRRGYYDMATFLDPRFAYKTEIYPLEKWENVEKNLEEILLKKGHEPSNYLEVKKELELYRNIVTYRPVTATDPFEWWISSADTFPILFNKAIGVVSPPPCCIDIDYYFGNNGKFSHMHGKMPFKQCNEWLTVAASQEEFRARGYMDVDDSGSKFRCSSRDQLTKQCYEREQPPQKKIKQEEESMIPDHLDNTDSETASTSSCAGNGLNIEQLDEPCSSTTPITLSDVPFRMKLITIRNQNGERFIFSRKTQQKPESTGPVCVVPSSQQKIEVQRNGMSIRSLGRTTTTNNRSYTHNTSTRINEKTSIRSPSLGSYAKITKPRIYKK